MDISSINSYNTDFMETTKSQLTQKSAQSFEDALNKAVEQKDDVKLKQSCKEFESYFLGYMFKQAQNTVYSLNEKNSIITRSQGEKIFSEMLIDEYSEKAAEQGGFGLADMLYNQLK